MVRTERNGVYSCLVQESTNLYTLDGQNRSGVAHAAHTCGWKCASMCGVRRFRVVGQPVMNGNKTYCLSALVFILGFDTTIILTSTSDECNMFVQHVRYAEPYPKTRSCANTRVSQGLLLTVEHNLSCLPTLKQSARVPIEDWRRADCDPELAHVEVVNGSNQGYQSAHIE